MALMIPYKISPNAPSGERLIFDIINNDERTKDWVVLHSLRIENHIAQYEGEADFVILSPCFGCFVIEVKGGEFIKCENGTWTSIDRRGNAHHIKDPFEQASKNKYSIEKYLKSQYIDSPVFGFGVAFPETSFSCNSISYSDEQIFDCRYNNDFFSYVKTLSEYHVKKAFQNGYSVKPPSTGIIDKIRLCLRPNYESITTFRQSIKNNDVKLLELLQQQYEVLDKLEYAASAIVHGPAGTGKTLLAVEMAKRKAAKNGTKVALITYNLYLTEFLHEQVKDVDNIDVFSISDYFEKKCRAYHLIDNNENTDPQVFYKNILPKLATTVMCAEPKQYDAIVVDEAQDFTALYLILISLMLKGHIANGNYYFFGDFVYQGIYDTSVYKKEFHCYIEAMNGNPIEYELTTNVRNSADIQTELKLLSSPDSNPSYTGSPEIYHLYEDESDEAKQIEKLLNKLIINEKIPPSQITVLGRIYYEKSVVRNINKYRICEYGTGSENDVKFSTIRKFKGLENEVILVVDNNYYSKQQDLDLLYVAMSRAKYKVVVFEKLEAAIQREELIKNKCLHSI